MVLADAHVHLFTNPFAELLREGSELPTYERLREHHNIDCALVVGYEGDSRYVGNNDYVLELARTRQWIVPLVFTPVATPPTVEELRRVRGAGAAGLALYLSDEDDGAAFCAWPAATLAELRAQRSVLSLNARPAATAVIEPAVAALEECSILFSHLGLPGRVARPPAPARAREHLAPLLALAGHAHVAVKLSGLYAISEPAHDFPHASAQPFVDVMFDAFGPTRLLWGSDFSPALDFVSFAQAADARPLTGCTGPEVADVMGGNLLRLVARRQRGSGSAARAG